jgi:signal transduction histidine kinase
VQAAERIQNEQLASVSSAFLKLRPKLLAPMGPALLLLLVTSNAPRSQVLAIGAVFVCMLTFFVWESQHVKQRAPSPSSLCRSLMLTVVGIAALCSFSGGTRSPFLVILFAPLGVAFAAFGRSRGTSWVGTTFLLALSYLTFAPTWWPAPGAPHVNWLSLLASLLSATLLLSGVTGLAMAYRQTALRLEAMRSEMLAASSEHSARLESVGAEVAHELKNPLASIKALVQLVHAQAQNSEPSQDPALSQNRAQEPMQASRNTMRLSVVLDEVSRMESVLADYLGFSRSSSPVQRTWQDCRAFFELFIQLLEGEAARQQVTCTLICETVDAYFDPPKLHQALLNLSQNALLAMPEGGTLTLQVQAQTPDLHISVTDTGQGMSPEVLSRVKVPYFSRRSGGTGLGVALANNLIQQHGGSLSFESQIGIGTRAHVLLPQKTDSPPFIATTPPLGKHS